MTICSGREFSETGSLFKRHPTAGVCAYSTSFFETPIDLSVRQDRRPLWDRNMPAPPAACPQTTTVLSFLSRRLHRDCRNHAAATFSTARSFVRASSFRHPPPKYASDSSQIPAKLTHLGLPAPYRTRSHQTAVSPDQGGMSGLPGLAARLS